MITVNDLHPQAMDLADQAFWHRRKGDEKKANTLFLEALKLEKQAASLLPAKLDSEPSRSILYRSAASLAYNYGDYEMADWLIANGLAGFPPPEIKEELKNLYDDVNFMRHLATNGISLCDNQWLMTIWGNATGHGLALVDHLMLRVERVTTMFYRTLERLLERPYRVNGSVSKDLKADYAIYINAFAPSSFAVSFQVGHPDIQLPLFPNVKIVDPESVIDELMECFEILEGPQPEKLKERFDDTTYYENFVGLVKEIAPDGDKIKLVGFKSIKDGKEKPVTLRKNRKLLRQATPVSPEAVDQSVPPQQHYYKGILRYANSPNSNKYGTVRLTDIETGIPYSIKVPIALMKDVVQPYYGEMVNIIAIEKKGKLYLEEVTLDS